MNKFSLEQAIYDGVLSALDEYQSEGRGELAGFSLCTDDDLVTVLCHAVDHAELSASEFEYEDVLFCPTQWSFFRDTPIFDEAAKELQGRPKSIETIEDRFEVLIKAMTRLKSDGHFKEGVYLSVISTDPGELTERLGEVSIERLNEADLVQRRKNYLLKWA